MSKKKIKDTEINKKNMIIKKLNHYALIENKINNNVILSLYYLLI